VELLAIEPPIRPRPDPCDADYASAKQHSADQCLFDPRNLPQTKNRAVPTATMPKSCKDALTVPVRMSLSSFLRLWMQRTTSFCRNPMSRDVLIRNPKNQSAAHSEIDSVGRKKWLPILAIRQG
jgi:hypothetical protein